MIRWFAFAVWVAITFGFAMWAFSEFIFGSGSGKRLLLRLLCSLVWPIAILGESGRKFLFSTGVKA